MNRSAFYKVLPLCLFSSLGAVEPPSPYGAIPSKGQLAWHELEMYSFIHFTTNTFTDLEWGYGDESPGIFNPTDFSADQIVGTLVECGFKGLILTAKHHDGFCLWPTDTTGHNVSASPWKNGQGDMVQEFSDACRRHGIQFGVYLSPWDRNTPLYGTPAYVDMYRAQLRELLSHYGPIFEVWHDGANGGTGYYGGARERRSIDNTIYYDWQNTYPITYELQPNAVIFSDVGPGCRWIGNEHGIADYPCWATFTPVSPDGDPPAPGHIKRSVLPGGMKDGKYWIPGECDVSIRPGWFWHEHENDKVRSPENLMNLYYASVGRGASFLLNVPPDRRGRIHENDVESLREFKQLLDQLYAQNLAEGAKVMASSERGQGFEVERVLDRLRNSYWATPDGVTEANLIVELPEARTFSVIRLGEAVQLGQRIRKFSVDARVKDRWQPWMEYGRSVGAQVLMRGEKVSADAVRLNITESAASPCLSELSLWLAPDSIHQ